MDEAGFHAIFLDFPQAPAWGRSELEQVENKPFKRIVFTRSTDGTRLGGI